MNSGTVLEWSKEAEAAAGTPGSGAIGSKVIDLSIARDEPGKYFVWNCSNNLFLISAPAEDAGVADVSIDIGSSDGLLENEVTLVPGGRLEYPFKQVVIANRPQPGKKLYLFASSKVQLPSQVDIQLLQSAILSVNDVNDVARQAWGENSSHDEYKRVYAIANLSAEKMLDIWQKQLQWNVKNNIQLKKALYIPGSTFVLDNTGGLKRVQIRSIQSLSFPDSVETSQQYILYRAKVNVVSTGGTADDAFYATDAIISPVSENAILSTAPSIFADKYAYSGPGFQQAAGAISTSFFSAQFRPVIIPPVSGNVDFDTYTEHRIFAEVHFPRASEANNLRLDNSTSYEWTVLQGIVI